MKKLILSFLTTLLFLNTFSQTNEIIGIVKNNNTQAPLNQVSVVLFLNHLYQETAITDSCGEFRFTSLPSGNYECVVQLNNFVKTKGAIKLSGDSMISLLQPIMLKPLVFNEYGYDDATEDREVAVVAYKRTESAKADKHKAVGKPAATSPSFLGSRANQTAYYKQGVVVVSGNAKTLAVKSSPVKQGEIGTHVSGTYAIKSPPVKQGEFRRNANNQNAIADTTIGVNQDKISAEAYNEIIETPFKSTHKNLLSTFSIDVDCAAYSNMRRYLQQNLLPPKDVVRTEELLNYFTYNYPQPSNDAPFSITTEMAECPWNAKHKLVHIGIQGKIIPMDAIPPMNLVFLVDVSGSMQTYNKLPFVIESLKMLIAQLRATDKICIVTYAGMDGIALPPTSGNDKVKIYEALNNLSGGGGTNGSAGIIRAYQEAMNNFVKDGINRVILCTDGDFNIGVSDNTQLENLIIEKRKSGVFLSVLGFGMGNYKDNKMETLADKGNGNYAYIDKLEEAKKVLVHEMGGTLFTIAKDVKIQMEFNPMFVKEYRLIGYENRLLKNEDFENDAIDAGDLGSGHTVTAIYEIVPNTDKTSQGVLQYDPTDITPSKLDGDEWLLVKMRYKNPNDSISKLLVHKLSNEHINNPTANFYYSAAVAEFAMLMHESIYLGTGSFEQVEQLLEQYTGDDALGYKKEFKTLVVTAAKLMKEKSIVKKD